MNALHLTISEPFFSPAWGSNFVVFQSDETISEDCSKEYMRKVCKYAKTHGVYLVPERFHLMDFQCLCLISPEGKVVGAQKNIYLNARERLGKHSASIEVLNTEFGGIFLCVDVDIYRPELIRAAANMGAQFIICNQTIKEQDYNSAMVLTGAWNAAQNCQLYVVDTANTFNCICAPLSLTKHADGFIAPPNLKLPLTIQLNADSLRKLPPLHRLGRKFYAVHKADFLR